MWRGTYDVWDRLFEEKHPTGAFVERRFDEAHNQSGERIFDGDPTGELLSELDTHVTSFGRMDRLARHLDGAGAKRMTERQFDGAGRLTLVERGPETGEGMRRELEYMYEAGAGRILGQRFGGPAGGASLYERTYDYSRGSPWPDTMAYLESVPGEADQETFTTSYRRDALGRSIEARSNHGRLVHQRYDRLGRSPIQRTDGAGTSTGVGLDARGRVVRHLRPNNRGVTCVLV